MMKNYRYFTVGEIVASDIRTASVFKKAGIDFCCGGNMSLEEACAEKGLDAIEIEKQLSSVENEKFGSHINFLEWKVDFLSDYIVNTHHKFVEKMLPELDFYLKKISSVHGENHPELKEILFLFEKLHNELRVHLKNEEEVLFPAIKEVLVTNSIDAKLKISSEVDRMKGEHEFAGWAMDRINEITNNYSLPADGCNTYKVTYELLEKFEDDLHMHVHLENNILYPKALELSYK